MLESWFLMTPLFVLLRIWPISSIYALRILNKAERGEYFSSIGFWQHFRAEASQKHLEALNPYVRVSITTHPLTAAGVDIGQEVNNFLLCKLHVGLCYNRFTCSAWLLLILTSSLLLSSTTIADSIISRWDYFLSIRIDFLSLSVCLREHDWSFW